MFLSFLGLSLFSEYHMGVNLCFFVAGAGGSAVGVNIFPIIVDMCSNREPGKYTGLYYTVSMTAQIITPIASVFLPEHISYRTLFPYAAVFSLSGLLMLPNVQHGECRITRKQKLWEYLDT